MVDEPPYVLELCPVRKKKTKTGVLAFFLIFFIFLSSTISCKANFMFISSYKAEKPVGIRQPQNILSVALR